MEPLRIFEFRRVKWLPAPVQLCCPASCRIYHLAVDARRLVTDAEVLQEILHRYVAICSVDRGFDAVPGVTCVGA